MARSLGAALIAVLALALPARAQHSAERVAENVRRVTDASLSDAARGAAWTEVEASVDHLVAAGDRRTQDETKALLTGAAFFLRCLGDGAYGPERVLPVLDAALAGARTLEGEDERVATFVFHLARLRIARGETSPARSVLDEHLPRLERSSAHEAAWCCLLRATVERLEARPIEALAWIERGRAAMDPARHASHRLLAPTLCSEAASTWLELGLPELAARAVVEQRAAAEGIPDPLVRHGLGLQEARVEFASGRWPRARERAHAGATLDEPAFVEQERIRSQYRLIEGLAAQELGALDPALARSALDLLATASTSSELSRVERVEACLSLFAGASRLGDLAVAGRAIERAGVELGVDASHAGTARLERPPGATTLQWVRWIASRARWARLRGAPLEDLRAARDELRAAWVEFLATWDRTPLHADGVGFLQYSFRRFVPAELVEIELAASPGSEGVARAFEHLLEAQARGSLARSLGAATPSIDRLRRETLADSECALVFLPAPNGSHVFLLDAHDLRHERLPPEAELLPMQRDLARDLLARPAAGAASPESAARLGAALVPASARASVAKAKRLTFTGLALLGLLPPAALDVPGIGVLGTEREIAELPSLAIGAYLAARETADAGSRTLDLLVLAAPEPSAAVRERWPGLAELPWEPADARAMHAGTASERVLVLERSAATRAALEQHRPRVLTVFGHGVQDERRTPAASLVLAPSARDGDDGLVHVDDIARIWPLRDAPSVVVLGTCGASRAPLRRGDDGVNHFGGAFLASGASCVLASSADLDDEATRRLVARVHSGLLAGATPSGALLEARRAVAADERFRHPHFHALLGASGLGHRVPR